jgi:hypothetical protein
MQLHPYLENQRVFIAGDSVSLNPNQITLNTQLITRTVPVQSQRGVSLGATKNILIIQVHS